LVVGGAAGGHYNQTINVKEMPMRQTLIATLAILACAPLAHAQPQVKIGSASPLSGPSAHQGKDIENGARLAIDDLNAQGATIAGRKVKWVLQAEDDGSDPKLGTAVAQKLVDGGVAAVVGHLNSGTTVPASKIYNSAGIPQISPAATTPLYTHQGYKTAFRVVANDDLVGRVLARYAIDTLKAKKIAIIDDRTAFGQGLADQFAQDVKRLKGAEIVSRQFTSDRATDFSAILTQIRARRPDVIFYGGMDATAGPMLKQMQALGIDAKFVSGDGVCSEKLPLLAGSALGDDKVVCVVAGGVDAPLEAGMTAFAAAMRAAGSSDPAAFLPALARIKYQGITGTIAFDANGDLRDAALTLYTYRKGQLTKLRVVR